MSQMLHTKNFGPVTFVRTWWAKGSPHVGRMPNGAYAHINGLPVRRREELASITDAEEIERAIQWLERRDRQPAAHEAPLRRVFFEPTDESWRYLDNQEPVEKIEDLVAALKGESLTQAVTWFQHAYQARQTPAPGTAPPLPHAPDEQVLKYLQEAGPQTGQEIATALGFDARATVELIQALREANQIVVSGKRYYLNPEMLAQMTPAGVAEEEG